MTTQVLPVTGCSTGIGRAVAQPMTAGGCTVVARARAMDSLDDVAAATQLALDVTDPAAVQNAVHVTLQRHGRIDVLVNNAGYAVRGAVVQVPDDAVRAMFDVSVFGVLRMIRAVAPVMREQDAGRIITISSIAGKTSTPGNGTYSASKFAVEALSDALAVELRPSGVVVSLVEPGAIDTQFDRTSQHHSQAILANRASPHDALYAAAERVATGMRSGEPDRTPWAQVVHRAIQACRSSPQ